MRNQAGWRNDVVVVIRATGYRVPATVGMAIVGVLVARLGGPSVRGETAAVLAMALLIATVVNPGIGWEASRLARERDSSFAFTKMYQVLVGGTCVLLLATCLLLAIGKTWILWPAVLGFLFLWSQNLALLLVAERGSIAISRLLALRSLALLSGVTVLGLLGLVTTTTALAIYCLAEVAYTVALATVLWANSRAARHDGSSTRQPSDSQHDGLRVRISRSGREMASLIAQSERWQLSRLAEFALLRVGVIYVAFRLGSAEAGILAVALSIGEICLLVSAQVSEHFFHRQDLGVGRKPLEGLKLVLPAALAPVAAIVATGSLLIPKVFGQDYRESYAVFLALSLGVVGFAIMSYASAQSRALGTAVDLAWISMPALAANVLVMVLLVPQQGAIGAAIAFSSGASCGALMAVLRMSRFSQYPDSPSTP